MSAPPAKFGERFPAIDRNPCSTAGAFVVYFRLLGSLGSVGTASVAYLRAAVSVAIGIVFLGELPSWQTAGGLALVLIGVAAMTLPAMSYPFRFRPIVPP